MTTKGTLEMLRQRAYSRIQFERLAAESAFRTYTSRERRSGWKCA
jgi:hypothetical protein